MQLLCSGANVAKREPEHSRQSRASHGRDLPTLRDFTFAWGEYLGFYTLSSQQRNHSHLIRLGGKISGRILADSTLRQPRSANLRRALRTRQLSLRTAVRRQAVKQSAVLRSAFVFCSKLQRVSSEDRRTTVLGQAVYQSAEMRSALEFFATAHSFRERSIESVN